MLLTANDRTALIAALGPTNTGKTHRAVERMLEHDSGMIGLPLRLLAREVYDRVSMRVGTSQVALVTGEEKVIPVRPAYWVCTTESMPIDREVDFVAIDEIQLAAHPQRGHVFTDRILRARGRRETWFMGSDTMRGVLDQMVPHARVEEHPRFSSLSNAGSLALGALPPRSAVVAFTASQVYEIAERLRARRGGAAVVLGALSPRTRNAQVAMYQSGEVQYMVATDAIGMGLNMDVDLVAFASVRKFDGREFRALETAELAQIAGRAGRHIRDGRFATLAPLPPLSDETVFALETHRFAPLQRVYWRDAEPDYSSVDALIASLAHSPPRPFFRRVEQAEDLAVLQRLAQMPHIRSHATSREMVELLWQVCRIPDYRQLLAESHASLLAEIFMQLAQRGGRVDPAWMRERIDRLDSVEGDIETLMARISFVRTWTYVAHRTEWVADAHAWQERTRQLEDRLSDALHDALVQRFVEPGRPRVRHGGRRLDGGSRATRGGDDGAMRASPFQALAALKLPTRMGDPRRAMRSSDGWVARAVDAPHAAFAVDPMGRILFEGTVVARMTEGVDMLRPDVALLGDLDVGPGDRVRLQRRLIGYARDLVQGLLAPLRGPAVQKISPAGRGLIYQVERGLGTVMVSAAREQIRLLGPDDWRALRRIGVRVGRHVVYVRRLLERDAVQQRMALVAAARGAPLILPAAERSNAFPVDGGVDEAAWTAVGFPVFGGMAIRADVLERVAGTLSALAGHGPFEMPDRVIAWLGRGEREAALVAQSLGFVREPGGWSARRRHPGRERQTLRSAPEPIDAGGERRPTRTRAGRSSRSPMR